MHQKTGNGEHGSVSSIHRMNQDRIPFVDNVVNDSHYLTDLARLTISDYLVTLSYMRIAFIPGIRGVLDAVSNPHV